MKIRKLIILMISFLMVNTGSAQDVLNAYLETAARNNPGLQAKFSDYMAALQVGLQVKALPNPQLAFAYFVKPVETRLGPQEFRISVNQMFPWRGTLKAKENVAIQQAKAKYEVFEDFKSELYYNVRSAYYNLYYSLKSIEITRENIGILETFKRLALIKVAAGKVSAVDEIRIEIEIADFNNKLLLLQDIFQTQQILFTNLLNIDSKSEIILEDKLVQPDLSSLNKSLIDSIISDNHQLRKLNFQLAALEYREIASRKMGMPAVSLGIDYIGIGTASGSFSGDDAIMFPKVGLSIPLYRNKYKAMVDEVRYLVEAKNFEKINKVNSLETIFENSWKNYSDASRRIELYKSQQLLANRAIKLLESEYATNGKNFEEILRMERNKLKFQLALEKANADQLAAIAFINYLMGKN